MIETGAYDINNPDFMKWFKEKDVPAEPDQEYNPWTSAIMDQHVGYGHGMETVPTQFISEIIINELRTLFEDEETFEEALKDTKSLIDDGVSEDVLHSFLTGAIEGGSDAIAKALNNAAETSAISDNIVKSSSKSIKDGVSAIAGAAAIEQESMEGACPEGMEWDAKTSECVQSK